MHLIRICGAMLDSGCTTTLFYPNPAKSSDIYKFPNNSYPHRFLGRALPAILNILLSFGLELIRK